MRVVTAVAALFVAVAAASAASDDRVVTSPGNVLALARSGFSVGFLAGPHDVHCGPRVELWDLAGRGIYRLGRETDAVCREGPSAGSGVTDFAVAHHRALWLAWAGGTQREWVLYTATTTRPTERRLEFEITDFDAPSPIVVGVASESVLPYSVRSTLKVLTDTGRLLYRWRAPAQVTNSTAYGSQVAVFVKGGRCFVLSPSGSVLQTYTFHPGSVQEFALSGSGLVVQLTGGRVEIHRGSSVTKLKLPDEAQMLDFAERILLYKLGDQIRARRVGTGKDVLLRRATFAQLEHNGLSYARGRGVYSVAMAKVLAALAR